MGLEAERHIQLDQMEFEISMRHSEIVMQMSDPFVNMGLVAKLIRSSYCHFIVPS